MRPLWPDLEFIRARLFERAETDITDQPDVSGNDVSVSNNTSIPVMPTAIRDQIARRAAAQIHFQEVAGSGDVVFVRQFGEAGVVVLLDAKIVGEKWQGWIVSPDTDYASDKDVLIEPDDGPSDPTVGMVQTWQPVQLEVPIDSKILARLTGYRLSIIREIAKEANGDPADADPGRIGLRTTESGRLVLTGSPLGNENDKRLEYQSLYRKYAAVLSPTRARQQVQAIKETRSQAPRISDWLFGRKVSYASAAAIAVIGGLLVAKLLPLSDHTPTISTQVTVVNPELSHQQPGEISASQEATSASEQNQPSSAVLPEATAGGGKPPSVVSVEGKETPKVLPQVATTKIAEVKKPAAELPMAAVVAPVRSTAISPAPTQDYRLEYLVPMQEAVRTSQYLQAKGFEDQLPSGLEWSHLVLLKEHDAPTALKFFKKRNIFASRLFSNHPIVVIAVTQDTRFDLLEKSMQGEGYFLQKDAWVGR